MGVAGFIVTFALGTAALAFWIHARFPQIAPESLRGGIAHVCLAVLFSQLALVPLQTVSGQVDTLVVLFACVLPTLVYSFLAAVWVFRTCQQMLGGAIR